MAELLARLGEQPGPSTVVDVVGAAVDHLSENAALQKVISDEAELVGPFLARHFDEALTRWTSVAAPILQAGMTAGMLRTQDPDVLVEWLTRTTLSLALTPARGDVRVFLGQVLLPALTPGPGGSQ
ncbi:MAG: hypothetical protein ACYDD6_05350 [Acidimicrobiales bacterium]